ncbi:MAG: DUF6785 family protein [Armatimonadota bacterium]
MRKDNISASDKMTKSPDGKAKRGITLRSIIIGFIISICHTIWVLYEEGVFGNLPYGFGYTTFILIPSILGLIFVFLVINSFLKRVRPSAMFSPSELMVIFVMCTVSTTICGGDQMQLLFPVIMSPYQTNAINSDYEKFFNYIPRWFAPQNHEVRDLYFLGTHQFWGFFRPEIIKDWALPMLFWGGLLATLVWTMLCLVSILRKQWLEREKLPFPILEIPMMMVRSETVGSFFKSPLMKIGFLITVFMLSLNYCSSMYPSIPGVRLHLTNLAGFVFQNFPLNGMNPVWVSWWPFAIGLCYLIPLDILFSCWFFYVLIRLSMLFATSQGWREPNAGFRADQFPFFQDIAPGAWIGMFIIVMWSARSHLKRIVTALFDKSVNLGDEKEPMAYRKAVLGFVIGFVILAVLLIGSGLRPHFAILFLGIYLMAITVMTRIYAQIAVPIFELYFFNSVLLTTNLTGSNALTYGDAGIMAHFHWLDRCYRNHPMGHELESITFADKQHQNMRLMTKIILMALFSGIIIGILTILQITYNQGGNPGAIACGRIESWNRSVNWIANPKPIQVTTLLKIGSSMVIVFLLAFTRAIWFGFPLHPIGYAFACAYSMEYIWNIVLICWFIKFLVLRYGGLRLYQKSLPFFFGLVIGDAVTQFVWTLVFCWLRVKGASPYGYPIW